MNRREVMKTTAAGALLSFAALGETPAAKAGAVSASGVAGHKAVYEAAIDCARVGTECLDLCIRSLSIGDKMMAECAATVRAMLPLCNAVSSLAMLDSKHLKALAAVCAQACRDCEAACKKHAAHHAECKVCMDSCRACAEACEKV